MQHFVRPSFRIHNTKESSPPTTDRRESQTNLLHSSIAFLDPKDSKQPTINCQTPFATSIASRKQSFEMDSESVMDRSCFNVFRNKSFSLAQIALARPSKTNLQRVRSNYLTINSSVFKMELKLLSDQIKVRHPHLRAMNNPLVPTHFSGEDSPQEYKTAPPTIEAGPQLVEGHRQISFGLGVPNKEGGRVGSGGARPQLQDESSSDAGGRRPGRRLQIGP